MHHTAPARFRRIISILLTLTILAFCSAVVIAQSGTAGTLTGVVKDPNGANLAGVSVVVRNIGTGAIRTTTTDESGHWTMPGLPIGTYEVATKSRVSRN